MPAGFTVVASTGLQSTDAATYVVRAPNRETAIDIVVKKFVAAGDVTFSANPFFSDMLLDIAPGDAVLVDEFAA